MKCKHPVCALLLTGLMFVTKLSFLAEERFGQTLKKPLPGDGSSGWDDERKCCDGAPNMTTF